MKNIHILPTDKPSRFLYNSTLKSFCIQKEIDGMFINDGKVSGADFWGLEKALNNGFKPYNIHITSPNEDINENDYIITKDGRLVEVSYLLSNDLEGASKIVLTTDPMLSPDVHKIPDEFLEWFVKNPSCEEVEVIYDYFQVDQNNPVFRGSTALVKQHKIIIPKEEPKQERMYSEEEVYHILCEHTAFLFAGGKSTLTDWFKQFKKK